MALLKLKETVYLVEEIVRNHNYKSQTKGRESCATSYQSIGRKCDRIQKPSAKSSRSPDAVAPLRRYLGPFSPAHASEQPAASSDSWQASPLRLRLRC